MKHDAAFEALKRANPEPDPAALRRRLGEGTTIDLIGIAGKAQTTPPTNLRPRRQWRPALAAGLAVSVVVAAMLVPWTGNQSVLDRILSSPIDIASSYMEARNSFDTEAAASLLTEDAFLWDVPRMERAELDLGFEALRVYGWQLAPFDCNNTPGTTLVTCNYLMNNRLTQIVGRPLVEGRMQFLVVDGRIASLVHDLSFEDYGANVHEPYIAWLDEQHPGATDQLFIVKDGVLTPILTAESLALAADYLDRYDRFLNG
jgi:hypothetical protein